MLGTKLTPQAQVAIFFAITQILGIFSGMMLISSVKANPELADFSVAPLAPNDPANALFFLIYILAGAAMVLLAGRFFKGMIFFRLLEVAVVASASSIVFLAIGLFMGLDFVSAVLLAGVAGLGLAALKFFMSGVKNAAAIISSAGVAAIFGFSLGFLPTAIFVIFLSIYDYIAVFKTKHMIEMARSLSTRELSFAITAKNVPARMPKEKTEVYVERAMREGERLDLGTGDLSVPGMLSVSAFSLGANGPIYAAAIAIGSTISIYFLLQFVAKQRVFLPALPPICFGGMLSLLIVKLLGF